MNEEYWAGQKKRIVYTTCDGKRFINKENAILYCALNHLPVEKITESEE